MPPGDDPSPALREKQSSVTRFLTQAAGQRSYLAIIRKDKVWVHLRPDEVSLAAELLREFGSTIEVNVGFKVFPSGKTSMGRYLSGQLQEAARALPGIHMSFKPPEITVHRGEIGSGKVVIHNAGTSKLAGPIDGGLAWLRRPRTTVIVGGYYGPTAGVGLSLSLNPGESVDIGFITGTASCEPGPDYVVPAGRYELVVPLSVQLAGEEKPNQLAAEGGFAVIL